MRLIDDFGGLGAQGLLVPSPVVTAEQQIGTSGQNNAHVRLGVASVAAVGGAQGGCGKGR